MVRGDALSLSRDQQAFVASYILKTVMLLSVWSRTYPGAAFPAAYLRAFRESATPPAGMTIWIGCMDDNNEVSPGGVRHGREPRISWRTLQRGYLGRGARGSGLTLGHMTAHWVLDAERVSTYVAQRGLGIPAIAEAEGMGFLSQVWPVAHDTLDYGSHPMYVETNNAVRASIHVDFNAEMPPV